MTGNGSQQTQQHSTLYQLAEAVGIACHWRNFRDQPQTVSPENLRKVLKALGIDAEDEKSCQRSLDGLAKDGEKGLPALLVATVEESVALPGSLLQALGNKNVALQGENGQSFSEPVKAGDDGKIYFAAPANPGYYRLSVGDVVTELAVAPRCCTSVRDVIGRQRGWGVAAQIYSLRGEHDDGAGDFSSLREFAVAMAKAGADAIAISPVHALFAADENRYGPYAPSSRLFLNVLYIDPRQVFSEDLIQSCQQRLNLPKPPSENKIPPGQNNGSELLDVDSEELIQWPRVARSKLSLLRALWDSERENLLDPSSELGAEFKLFREREGETLQLHATFEALHAHHFSNNSEHWHWRSWPEEFQNPHSEAVKSFTEEHHHEVMFHAFLQWLADRGLREAHQAARDAGAKIGLIADLAVGTDSGGSHSWSRQGDMLSGLSVGAPPDMLHHLGQSWGITTFSPRSLTAHGYKPFIEMLRACLRHAGGLRIDHILGLRRMWLVVDGNDPRDGAYLEFPQDDMLKLIALESWRHNAVIIGEDLGTIPDNFRQQLVDVGLLGIRVLWFEKHAGLFVEPKRWSSKALATTTTHDLPTVAGWWRGRDLEWNEKLERFAEGSNREQQEQEREQEREALWNAFAYANVVEGPRPGKADSDRAIDAALRFVAISPSPLAIIPAEDLLAVVEQPNLPGTIDEHPNWRQRLPLNTDQIANDEKIQNRLAILRRERGG